MSGRRRLMCPLLALSRIWLICLQNCLRTNHHIFGKDGGKRLVDEYDPPFLGHQCRAYAKAEPPPMTCFRVGEMMCYQKFVENFRSCGKEMAMIRNAATPRQQSPPEIAGINTQGPASCAIQQLSLRRSGSTVEFRWHAVCYHGWHDSAAREPNFPVLSIGPGFNGRTWRNL